MPEPRTRRKVANGPTPPERQWIRLLGEWQKTGLHGSEWCRRQGLQESAFRFWKKETALRARRPQGRHSQHSSSVRLLPARVAESSRPAAILPIGIVMGR